MKIDFGMLDILVAAGAPAKAIVEYLRAENAKREPKRVREKGRQRAKRSQPTATIGNNEQQEATPEQKFYSSGKAILGRNAGGLLSSLLRHNNYDIPTAQRVIDEAAGKQDAREWVSASMRGKNGTHKDAGLSGAFDRLEQRLGAQPRETPDGVVPQGRLPRPGRVPGDAGGDPRAVRAGDRGIRDGPTDGPPEAIEVAPIARRGG